MSQTLGLEQPDTLNTCLGLATILMHEGRYEEAVKLAKQVQETNRHARGERDAITATATYTLARINARQGRADASFSLLQESIDTGLAPNLKGQMDRDPDLRSLHGDARWSSLLANAEQHASASQKIN